MCRKMSPHEFRRALSAVERTADGRVEKKKKQRQRHFCRSRIYASANMTAATIAREHKSRIRARGQCAVAVQRSCAVDYNPVNNNGRDGWPVEGVGYYSRVVLIVTGGTGWGMKGGYLIKLSRLDCC